MLPFLSPPGSLRMHASSQFLSAWAEKSKSRANLTFAFSECKKPLELRWEEKRVTLLSIMCAAQSSAWEMEVPWLALTSRLLLSPCQSSLTHSSQNEQNNAAHLPRFARFSARFLHLLFAALHPFSSPLVCWRCSWSCPFPLPRVTSASPAWPGDQAGPKQKENPKGSL